MLSVFLDLKCQIAVQNLVSSGSFKNIRAGHIRQISNFRGDTVANYELYLQALFVARQSWFVSRLVVF